MKSNPLVTVLMPVYNGGEYLRPSMESVLCQTYRNFEFLLINDCSTDNSLETIQSFKDPRIKVHTNQKNMGQTKSLNIGLSLAKGKYVVINDADDLSLPMRIEKQLDFILKHPECAVVGTSSFIMDQSGHIYRTFRKSTHFRNLLAGILTDTPVIHGSVIMNRDIIMQEGGYNENFKICQDYELWSSLIRKGFRIANLPDILVVIRQYKDSISFRESERQTIENGETMHRNIEALTSLKISIEDAIRQRVFFIAPGSLTAQDFRRAEELLCQEFKNFCGPFTLEANFASFSLKKKLVKPYAKLAMAEIKNGKFKEARKAALRFLHAYGFSSIMFMLWVLSHSPKINVDKVLGYYEKWQKAPAGLNIFMNRLKGR